MWASRFTKLPASNDSGYEMDRHFLACYSSHQHGNFVNLYRDLCFHVIIYVFTWDSVFICDPLWPSSVTEIWIKRLDPLFLLYSAYLKLLW